MYSLVGWDYSTYLDITTDSVVTFNGYDTETNKTVLHGLTISDFINVEIVTNLNGTLSVTINSLDGTFATEMSWIGGISTKPFVDIVCTNETDRKFSVTCKDFDKDIYLFGDSYYNMDESRIGYYLQEQENILMSTMGGLNSKDAYMSLENILKVSQPKCILWCLGMNDGTDGDTPSSTWLTNLEKVISLCETHDITLILSTIPTVPKINHEKKNEWVRKSGYRYIDYAKAVGATSKGVWYDGLLASDGVHPTVNGAKVLYQRLVTDVPEITMAD